MKCMYQVPVDSRIKWITGIFSVEKGTLILNFTYEQENKFLGISHGENHINFSRKFGDHKIVKFNDSYLYSIYDRNFPSQNISSSKMKSLLNKIKKYALTKGLNTIAINELNINKYDMCKFYNTLDKIFHEVFWNINIYLNSEINTEIKFIINSVRQIQDFGKNKPIIELKVNNTKVAALLDIGADVSIVDFDFIKKENIPIERNDGTGIMGVSGSTLQDVGTFNLKQNHIQDKMYVVKNGNLSTPFLLGCDFHKNNNVIINFKNSVIRINGQYVNWLKSDNCVLSEDCVKELKALKRIHTLPRSSTTLNFKLDIPRDVKYFQLTNVNWMLKKLGYTFPQEESQGIFPIIDGEVDIHLNNETNRNFGIFEGYTICEITLIKEMPTVKEYALKVSQIDSITETDGKTNRIKMVNEIIDKMEEKENINEIRNILHKNI